MTSETKPVKESYDVTIQRRASELCNQIGITDAKQIALVHSTLKETGLESWKNGLQAARNRAAKPHTVTTPESA